MFGVWDCVLLVARSINLLTKSINQSINLPTNRPTQQSNQSTQSINKYQKALFYLRQPHGQARLDVLAAGQGGVEERHAVGEHGHLQAESLLGCVGFGCVGGVRWMGVGVGKMGKSQQARIYK